jgi:hypothetical protein
VPRPPAPPKSNIDSNSLVVGGRGTETTVLLRFARLTIVEQGLRALFSSKK